MPNIRVAPGLPNPTHDISLSDGENTFGIRLEGGPKGIQEVPQTPSTLLINKQGSKFGDWDPSMSHLEQSDWTGGRGQESFVDDPSKFFDSQAAWTLTEGRILNAPQWKLAAGMVEKNFALPGSFQWVPLLPGTNRYLAVSFVASGNAIAEQAYMWIRRRGRPGGGGVNVQLCNNNAGDPGTVRKSGTAITVTTITDTISVFQNFDWAGTDTLTNGTTYWLKITADSTDTAASHWEVGCNGSAAGKISSDNSTWAASAYSPFWWLSTISTATSAIDIYARRAWKVFLMEGAWYAVARYLPPYGQGAAVSTLYINGDRGTVSSSASQTTVTDSSKSWTTNAWAGAKVRIIDGPGDGEWRAIVSNTSTALTVSPAFAVTQTTATRYVIYDTATWTLIGSNPANFNVTDVAVSSNIAYFACGSTISLVQFRSNPTTSAHEFSATWYRYAQLLCAVTTPEEGSQMFLSGINGEVVARWQTGDSGHVLGWVETGYAIDNTADKTKLNTAALPLKAWTVNEWASAKVTITAGPGVGEIRTISSNTATVLTVSSAFTVTHTAATQYAISGQTNRLYASAQPAKNWTANQWASGTVKIVGGPGIGESKTISSNTSNMLTLSATWTATLTEESQYQITAWATVNTAPLIYTPVGDSSYNITNMISYNNELYVFKEDSLWRVVNDRASQVPVGLDAMPATTNGAAAAAQNLFLYFSWSHSAERLYGGTLDDFGPWKGRGLPSGRAGPISAMEAVMAWLFVAIDGGPSGTSSILVWNGRGWHEIYRAFQTGLRIRSLKWVGAEGGRPKLYFTVGALLCYLDMPLDTLNPENDSTFAYQHESVVVTSTFDMGAARLPKLFKQFETYTSTLNRTSSTARGQHIDLDYQLDDDIGGTAWTRAGMIDNSPMDVLEIMRGNKRAIRFRLRINISSNTSPLPVRAYIVEGYARTPVKYQYNLRVQLSSLMRNYQGQPDSNPSVFAAWLKRMAGSASKITVQSIFPEWHNKLVVIEPPTILRDTMNKTLGNWKGVAVITVRDA